MRPNFRRLLAPLALVLLLVLAACGGGGQAAAPTEEPTEEAAPTRTPRPTREPAPTEAPTAVSITDSSSTTADGELAPVEIGSLQTYDHASGVFSIDIPENWTLEDNSKSDELILTWTDPTRNGAVIVDIFESDTTYTPEELTNLLNTFLESSFGSQPDFSTDDPVTQSDDSILIVWTYTASADNDVQATLLGNSFIEQRGNKVSILSTLVPQDQFDALLDQTNEIINAYRLNPDVALDGNGLTLGGEPTTEPATGVDGELEPVQIGALQTFDHPTGVFSIDVPENWTLEDNSKPDELILVWTDPTRNGALIVDIFEDETQYSAEELTDLLNTFLQNSFGSQPDFSTDDPVEQSDGSTLIVWTYTASADNDVQATLLGNSFIEQRGNKVSILSTLVPQDQFDDLLDQTNDIINTYRLNPDAGIE